MKVFDFFQKNSFSLRIDMLKQFINQVNMAAWSYDVRAEKFNFISNKMMELCEVPKNIIDDSLDRVVHFLNFPSSFDIESIKKVIEVEGKITHSYFLSLPNGETLSFTERIIGIKDENDELEFIIGINETESTQNIKDDVLSDLSDLESRRIFLKKLIEQNKNDKKISLAMLKINIYQFSKINEYFTYDIGNEVIRQTTERLNRFLHGKGYLIHGNGDNWIVILHPLSKNTNVLQIANQILEVVQSPLAINNQEIYIGANIGISLYPKDGKNQDVLLQHARTALKKASLKGAGNIEFYSTNSNIESFKHFQLIIDLHTALERKELYIEYQPKVDIKSLRVTGVEALLRWKHPVWGNVSPAEFIPLAEKYHLFETISEFVIEEVCQQIKKWQNQGIEHPNVSFNLSAEAFLNPYFLNYIQSMLKKYRIKPTCLEIEITEDVCLEDSDIVINLLNKFRDLGIRLALDDLGKGYSTLQYLTSFPFDTIKIDRSFISDLETSREPRIIIQSILEICKKLGIKTVAEGVEKKGQFSILKELGCQEVQGFYFSPSVSGNEIVKWFKMNPIRPRNAELKVFMERRKFFRVKLPQYLIGQMTIKSIQGKPVSLDKKTEILIKDIGPGGIGFYSYLQLPDNDTILFSVETELMQTIIEVKGKIVWSREYKKGIFEYGLEFSIDNQKREKLMSQLFILSSKLRDNPTFSEGSFTGKSPLLYFSKIVKKC